MKEDKNEGQEKPRLYLVPLDVEAYERYLDELPQEEQWQAEMKLRAQLAAATKSVEIAVKVAPQAKKYDGFEMQVARIRNGLAKLKRGLR